MKGIPFVTLVAALLSGSGGEASAQSLDTVRFEDAVWVKDAAEGLARCAGTYAGAAHVMREGGRDQGAAYLDSVATGALFAVYVMLSSHAAREGTVLDIVDADVYIEALARGSERNFTAMAERATTEGALSEALQSCIRLSSLQSAVLQTLMMPVTADSKVPEIHILD